MAGLADVAREAGVSISTASVVLNPGKQPKAVSQETTERVREAAKRLGYVPNYHARSMRLRHADTIGVALDTSFGHQPPFARVGNSYFGGLIAAIEVEAGARGYAMAVVGTEQDAPAPRRGITMCQQRRLDGLVVLGVTPESATDPFLHQPMEEPLVVVEYAPQTPLPVITWDEERAVRMAVEHLAGLGHRELLWLGHERTVEAITMRSREAIFVRAVWDAGLHGSSATYGHVRPGGTTTEDLVDAVAARLNAYLRDESRPPFTAIVCYNDRVAAGAYNALRAAGLRVPQDVSVVGFDNLEAPLLSPKLTSVDHLLERLGRRAADVLIEMIEEPDCRAGYQSYHEVIEPELVVRDSTAPPAGA